MPDLTDPIAVLRISAARRIVSSGVQVALGLLLVGVAANLPNPQPAALAALLLLGLVFLWQGVRQYQATGHDLVLTRDGLYDSSGATIAPLDQIEAVDRGFFAFKPSNGFLITLKTPATRAWVPGLWWRLGRRIGIGGATNGKAAREMADVIALLVADPNAGLPGQDGQNE